MNTMTEAKRLAVIGRQKMTPSEAFVETLVAQGVQGRLRHRRLGVHGRARSVPAAGIRFISVAHEQGAGHMADGYCRVSGSMACASRRTARASPTSSPRSRRRTGRIRRWSSITPETGSMSIGLGGFQETDQLPIFSKITKYQAHVNNQRAHGGADRRAPSTARSSRWGRRSSTFRATSSTAKSNARSRSRSAIERGPGGEQSLDGPPRCSPRRSSR